MPKQICKQILPDKDIKNTRLLCCSENNPCVVEPPFCSPVDTLASCRKISDLTCSRTDDLAKAVCQRKDGIICWETQVDYNASYNPIYSNIVGIVAVGATPFPPDETFSGNSDYCCDKDLCFLKGKDSGYDNCTANPEVWIATCADAFASGNCTFGPKKQGMIYNLYLQTEICDSNSSFIAKLPSDPVFPPTSGEIREKIGIGFGISGGSLMVAIGSWITWKKYKGKKRKKTQNENGHELQELNKNEEIKILKEQIKTKKNERDQLRNALQEQANDKESAKNLLDNLLKNQKRSPNPLELDKIKGSLERNGIDGEEIENFCQIQQEINKLKQQLQELEKDTLESSIRLFQQENNSSLYSSSEHDAVIEVSGPSRSS